MKSYKTYPKGETIVWAESDLTHLGSIVTGVAALSRTLEDGRCQIVGLLLPSDFIGRPGRPSVPYDVIAVTDVTLCRFTKPVFERILDRSPAIMRRMLAKTSDELDAAREWMVLLGRKTAREKLASFLAMLAKRTVRDDETATDDGVTITLPLSRAELGNSIGLTLQTTSRQISQLKEDGIIELGPQRTMHIPNTATLLREAGDCGGKNMPRSILSG